MTHRFMTPLCLFIILAAGIISPLYADSTEINTAEVSKLLARLDLNAPGLEKVKASADNPELAATELLAYYRARISVKHPVKRTFGKKLKGKSASSTDIKRADDALKHIFIGQKSYKPYFRGDDIDWMSNPVPDKEWIWQLHRMFFWDAMSKAYLHTGDEKYAREWCIQLQDWVKKNPLDKKHKNSWRSIEAGIRGHSWTALYQRFIDSPSFTPAVLTDFLNCFYTHSTYLMQRYSKGSNWALMEAEGLAFIALTFPEFKESLKWRDEAVKRLNQEIYNQVNADGHQRELSYGYHVGCISWFMRTLELAEMNGQRDMFPKVYLKTIEKMCAATINVSFPDGSTPQFGDSKTSGPGSTYRNLKQWSKLFNRPDFLYIATKGKEGVKPESTALALKASGFYSLRSGWNRDDIGLILKCGGNGGFHCQPDNGSFELIAGGRHLMPDTGCYIYSGDRENRNWFRATRNHQTLTLNEKNSAFAPELLLWQPGENLDMLVLENASYKDLTHRRSVCFVDKRYFIIVDEAIGDGTGEIDLNFQLAPEKAVFNNEASSVRTDFAEGWNVLIQPVNQEGMTLEEVKGQVSFHYTKKEPRPAFRYRIHKTAKDQRVRYITLVAPYNGKQPEIKITPDNRASGFDLTVEADGKTRRICYPLSN
ncbi:MAG: alginate lyase family protein [Kiritimatiellae bacterium]|jgi:heparan-sulfate lyase|nr:alginate lyase family protein [Kiritimatiellia bacterium]